MRHRLGTGISSLLITAAGIIAQIAGAEPDPEAALTVTVVDVNGDPVPDIAIMAHTVSMAASPGPAQSTARVTLAQQERAFVPHILIVEAGTVVEFPNHDEYLHHVYSFSEAKRFEFPLYGGAIAPELLFDTPGIVTLGCNIHDGMIGYIVVSATPHFALTDSEGHARFDSLADGNYRIETWTPRLRPDRLPEPLSVKIDASASNRVQVGFEAKLRPPHDDAAGTLIWERY